MKSVEEPTPQEKERIEAIEKKIYDLLEVEKASWGEGFAAISLVFTCLVANITKKYPEKEKQITDLFNKMRDSTIRVSIRLEKRKSDGKTLEW